MKVSELIKQLQQLPENADIYNLKGGIEFKTPKIVKQADNVYYLVYVEG